MKFNRTQLTIFSFRVNHFCFLFRKRFSENSFIFSSKTFIECCLSNKVDNPPRIDFCVWCEVRTNFIQPPALAQNRYPGVPRYFPPTPFYFFLEQSTLCTWMALSLCTFVSYWFVCMLGNRDRLCFASGNK